MASQSQASTSRLGASSQQNGRANEDARRRLRREYRSMIQSSEEIRTNLSDYNVTHVSEMIKNIDSLHKGVKDASVSILDSKVLNTAAEVGYQLARNIKVEAGFEIDDYVQKCVSLLGGRLRPAVRGIPIGNDLGEDDDDDVDDWNWDLLGRKAAKRTKRAPTLDFLLGPLAVEDKKRTVSRRAPIEKTGPLVKPAELKDGDIVKSELETTELVRSVSDRLQILGGDTGINYFQFVIDPDSFSNSVENIFYVSFLVRDGRVSLEDVDGEPMLLSVEQPTKEDYENGLIKSQLVMEFSMDDWKQLKELYKIDKAAIPSRAPPAGGDTWTGA